MLPLRIVIRIGQTNSGPEWANPGPCSSTFRASQQVGYHPLRSVLKGSLRSLQSPYIWVSEASFLPTAGGEKTRLRDFLRYLLAWHRDLLNSLRYGCRPLSAGAAGRISDLVGRDETSTHQQHTGVLLAPERHIAWPEKKQRRQDKDDAGDEQEQQ